MAVTLAVEVSVFFLRHAHLCSFQMSFMQALEQMLDSLQPEHRLVVRVLHHSQGLDLNEDMILCRASQYIYMSR